MENQYKVVRGISFDARTPDKVCNILASHCGGRNQRVRIFLGDTKTGKDWCEVYDTIGYIGRSTGNIKIPLMIATKNSRGGGAIPDHCIVKITIDKQNVYQHPNYHCPIEKQGNAICDTEDGKILYRRLDGNHQKLEREYQFLLGNRNAH